MKELIYSNSFVPGYVELKQYMGEDVLTQVNAARASFGKSINEITDRDRKLFKTCARDGHTSTMEHNVFTFAFKVPLFVARQHMRHRTWSFNEISRRYTGKDIEFFSPVAFRKQAESNRQASVIGSDFDPVLQTVTGTNMDYTVTASEALSQHSDVSIKLYEQLIQNGVSREQARMVLPQNMYTTYWGTVNLNNFLKFYELRNHEGAQPEIQEVAIACYKLLEKIIPETMEIYKKAQYEKVLRIIKKNLKNIPIKDFDITKYITNK